MRNVIIEKLRRQLVDPVDAECKVVYVLCEIRKVLEKDPPGLFALRMHCHWALHVDLTRPNTRRTFGSPPWQCWPAGGVSSSGYGTSRRPQAPLWTKRLRMIVSKRPPAIDAPVPTGPALAAPRPGT